MKISIKNLSGIIILFALPHLLFGANVRSFLKALNQKPINSDSLRTELRIKIVYDDYIVTPLVEVFINGVKTEVIFDTGSHGLRILSGALNGNLPDSSTKRVSFAYGDDKRNFGIRGRVQAVNIRMGNLKSYKPISIMAIDSERYGKGASSWIATGDSATIKSNHFRSVSAIMGVGLRIAKSSKGVANPLAQLPGNGKYIVQFPHFGGGKGKLILNPDTSDLKGFTLFKLASGKVLLPNGDSSWRDNELLGCANINGGIACQLTMLDTGNPDIHIRSKDFSGFKPLPGGSSVTLTLTDKTGIDKPIQTAFTVGNTREHGKDYVYLDETGKEGKNIFGMPFFFNYDVLYDQVNGVIGIREKH